jgi:hypothetical protein
VDINNQDKYGMTPLMEAINEKNDVIVDRLLREFKD